MITLLSTRVKRAAAGSFAFFLIGVVASAFPPSPHHTLYGLIRTELGNPLSASQATIILETPSGFQLRASLETGIEPGVNYRLEVPMDAGISADVYKPTALRPFFQFRLKVQVGQTVYLPIEMTGNFAQIGQPGESTRLDLTLGEDSDGDGLPDAWEKALIAVYGGTLASIRPNDDADGDGISNLNEYLAGTYAFDPSDGFRLSLVGQNGGNSQLEFMAIRGRNYTIYGTTDLLLWTPVDFRVVTGASSGALQQNYQASDVRLLRIEVPTPIGSETNRFFKAMVK